MAQSPPGHALHRSKPQPSVMKPRAPRWIIALALFGAAAGTWASPPATATPVGLWRVIGDASGEAEALVKISEHNGRYEGRIVELLPRPGVDPAARCEHCPGERRNQPIQGLLILNGLQRHGDLFEGGEILDPDSGGVYRCSLTVSDDNRKLFVRGYLGISLLGRTQTWLRQ